MTGTRVSRRSMLGSVGAASLAPTLLQASVPDRADQALSPRTSPAFVAHVQVGALTRLQDGSCWAPVTGGSVGGRRLTGRVQGGRIDWPVPSPGVPGEVTARLQVTCDDGRRVELHDRGLQPAGAHASGHVLINTTPQVVEEAGEWVARPALLVGRLDLAQLGKGILKWRVFEVS